MAERTKSLVSTGFHRGWTFLHCLVNGKHEIIGKEKTPAAMRATRREGRSHAQFTKHC